jgi:hypothetical protein
VEAARQAERGAGGRLDGSGGPWPDGNGSRGQWWPETVAASGPTTRHGGLGGGCAGAPTTWQGRDGEPKGGTMSLFVDGGTCRF